MRAFDSGRIGRAPAAALASPRQNARGQPPEVHDQQRRYRALDKPHARHRFGHPRRRRYHQTTYQVGSPAAMGNRRRAQGDTRRRAHGCTHRTHGIDFETRDAVSMRRRGQPDDAGVNWVVATPEPKRFSTSKQSPIRQQHQQLKVPMPSDVRELIQRKHTTITAVRGDPRRIGRVLGTPVPTERPATAPAGRRPYMPPQGRPRSARPWTTQGGRGRIDGKHTTVTAVRYKPRYKPPPIYCRGREVMRDDATYHTVERECRGRHVWVAACCSVVVEVGTSSRKT